MASSPSELTLDCKPNSSYSTLLKSFGDHQINDQTQKLEHFLSHLEDERLKIDAFKRELPLCMQLLTSAMEVSRQQLNVYRANRGLKPVLEEFIPLKNSEKLQNISDKANWMTTAQLWSQARTQTKPQTTIASPTETDIGFNVSPKLALYTKVRNGGAFLPFFKDRNSSSSCPDLALATVCKDMEDKKCLETENGISDNSGKAGNVGIVIKQGKGTGDTTDGQMTITNITGTNSTQPHRKARRCWSPDLHRRFVNALQMLGGSQVATPKQIRELMKVEGLTNDEVKSHLQKYRLHARRPSPSPQPAEPPTPQLVVLGGIWVPPEYATAEVATHGGAPSLYGAHHHPAAPRAPPHFCASPVPHEFYNAAATATPVSSPPPQLLHHQLHVYKAPSQAHSSPESDVRGLGDRSESIEDDKSERNSWKGESGDNGSGGDQRKGLAALREEGEESNESGITLKFRV